MVDKHKGGKGKRAEYQTQVMRVPTNLVPVVTGLVEQFHQQRAIAVTGITVEDAHRLCAMMEDETGAYTSCSLDAAVEREYYLQNDANNETLLAEYLELGDRVNTAIWGMDSSWKGMGDYAVTGIKQLVRFSLISAPVNHTPASAVEVAQFLTADSCDSHSLQDAVELAIIRGNYRVFAALYQPEVLERSSYWRQYYTSKLGHMTENYWGWTANPESRAICPELARLLDLLPAPDWQACRILEHIGEPVNPMYKAPLKKYYHVDGGFSVSGVFEGGSLHHYPDRHQYLDSFMHWLGSCTDLVCDGLLTQDELLHIMEVCFSCNRYRLEEMRQVWLVGDSYWGKEEVIYEGQEQAEGCWEVLGIRKGASKKDIKKAYREKSKQCHPDATQSTAEAFHDLTKAYHEALAQ